MSTDKITDKITDKLSETIVFSIITRHFKNRAIGLILTDRLAKSEKTDRLWLAKRTNLKFDFRKIQSFILKRQEIRRKVIEVTLKLY